MKLSDQTGRPGNTGSAHTQMQYGIHPGKQTPHTRTYMQQQAGLRQNSGQTSQNAQTGLRQNSGQTSQNAQAGLRQNSGQTSQNTQAGLRQTPPQATAGSHATTGARTASSLPGQNDKNIPEYLKSPSQQEAKAYPSSTQDSNSLRRAFDRINTKKTYDGTSDLIAIANAENEASLRGICVMLSYKLRHLKFSSSDGNTAKNSARKIKKVMGKAKSKIRKLQKEAQMEKKADIAKKARKLRLQMEIRRELSLRRKVRKAKERKDVADSYMESQMEQASQQATAFVAPDAVFTDSGSITSASIDIVSGDMALTDAAVTAVAESGGVASDAGGTIDLAL